VDAVAGVAAGREEGRRSSHWRRGGGELGGEWGDISNFRIKRDYCSLPPSDFRVLLASKTPKHTK
jgi:hypothetical protein